MNIYYWRNGEIEVSRKHCLYYDTLCVDTNEESAKYRLGYFPSKGGPYWTHVPLEDFPPEFRMNLLLMGIPV